jgi:hypothetical protein
MPGSSPLMKSSFLRRRIVIIWRMGRKATRKRDMRSSAICKRAEVTNLPSHAPNPVSKSHREKRIPNTISFPSKTFINSRITVIWVIIEEMPRAVTEKVTERILGFCVIRKLYEFNPL